MKKMSKYNKPLRNFIIYIAITTIILVILEPMRANQDLAFFLPGKGLTETSLMFIVFWPLGAIIGGVLFGYLLGPLYLFIHKKTIGTNMTYGIQDNLESKGFKNTFKAFFPALMAINFSLMFAMNENIAYAIVGDIGIEYAGGDVPAITYTLIAFIVLLSITIGVSMALFSPVWFLLDAGIVYSNRERVERNNLDKPIIGRSVGGWYMHLLKGYAGIAVLLSYFQLSINYLISMFETSGEINLFILIINVIILFPMMFLIAFASLPAIIILDMTKDKRVEYIRKWANKFGITKQVKIMFEEIS